MKEVHLAVLADIHGNLPAFEAVMTDLERRGRPDAILVAGDITGGPGQQAILQRLFEAHAILIQGNGEQRIAQLANHSAPEACFSAHQFSLQRWAYDHLTEEQLTRVCLLPEQRVVALPGCDAIRMVHGSPRNVGESVLPNRECHPNLFYEPVLLTDVIGLAPEPVLIFGHTHLQWQAHLNGKLAVNPGAVSFPEDNYMGAEYALLDWDGIQWQPTFQRVPYDLERIRQDYHESGFLAATAIAKVILQSILTGREYFPIFFAHVDQVSARLGYTDPPFYPDEAWDLAEATFPWKESVLNPAEY